MHHADSFIIFGQRSRRFSFKVVVFGDRCEVELVFVLLVLTTKLHIDFETWLLLALTILLLLPPGILQEVSRIFQLFHLVQLGGHQVLNDSLFRQVSHVGVG